MTEPRELARQQMLAFAQVMEKNGWRADLYDEDGVPRLTGPTPEQIRAALSFRPQDGKSPNSDGARVPSGEPTPYTREQIDALEKALHPTADAFVDVPADLMRNWRRRLLATARAGVEDRELLRRIYNITCGDETETDGDALCLISKLTEGTATPQKQPNNSTEGGHDGNCCGDPPGVQSGATEPPAERSEAPLFNGGQKCDNRDGFCSCGANHTGEDFAKHVARVPPEGTTPTDDEAKPYTLAEVDAHRPKARAIGISVDEVVLDRTDYYRLVATAGAGIADSERLVVAVDALERIQMGEGRFSRDPLKHAANTIDDMKAMAAGAIDAVKGTSPGNCPQNRPSDTSPPYVQVALSKAEVIYLADAAILASCILLAATGRHSTPREYTQRLIMMSRDMLTERFRPEDISTALTKLADVGAILGIDKP
jgi:hypothetical protein